MLRKSSQYNGKAFFKEPCRGSCSSSCLCVSSIITESLALACKPNQPHPSQVAWVVVLITAAESKLNQQGACLLADTPFCCGWLGLVWFGFREREKHESVDSLRVYDFNEGEVGVWKCEREPGSSKL